jgi:hypothetical protein
LQVSCRSGDDVWGCALLRNGDEVIVMDDMEEYTINDDLRACGLPGDDMDDLASGGEALLGSGSAPINVDGGDGGASAAAPPPPPPVEPGMPSSTQSVNTTDSIRLKRV